MSTFALVHPTHLLGEELKTELERRSHLWERLQLISDQEEEIGHLTNLAGQAAVVLRLDEHSFEGVDVAFFCGPIEMERPLLERLPETTTAIILSPDAGPGDGRPLVGGVSNEDVQAGDVLLSPHPGAILVTRLLHILAPLAPRRASGTITQPASFWGKEGLDELFEQTRAILAFAEERPDQLFGRQLAFNHYPPQPAGESLAPVVKACLGQEDLPLALRTLQGGIFHAVSVSLALHFAEDPGAEALHKALEASPYIDLASEGSEGPSPVEASSRDEILVGRVRKEEGEAGTYWLWAVMDNLTVGGAVNAVDIAEGLPGVGRVH